MKTHIDILKVSTLQDNTCMVKTLMKTMYSKDTHEETNSVDILDVSTLADLQTNP